MISAQHTFFKCSKIYTLIKGKKLKKTAGDWYNYHSQHSGTVVQILLKVKGTLDTAYFQSVFIGNI